jgi:hypothetical protein
MVCHSSLDFIKGAWRLFKGGCRRRGSIPPALRATRPYTIEQPAIDVIEEAGRHHIREEARSTIEDPSAPSVWISSLCEVGSGSERSREIPSVRHEHTA